MRLAFCVACGERDPEKLEHHHLVPLSAGGPDVETNLVTLCHVCHGRAHGYERRNIGRLAREGLAAAKARGTKLGGDRGNLGAVRDAGRALAIQARRARAGAHATDLAPVITDLRASGVTTLAALADALNEKNIPAARGGSWSPVQVSRALSRIDAA